MAAQQTKKLYELPRKTHFKFLGNLYFLDHIDGMYSLCYDELGAVIHLSASIDVEPLNLEDSHGIPQ